MKVTSSMIWNTKLISRFMTLQPGWKTNTIHIFSNISWSKSNKTIKWGREASSKPLLSVFLKKFLILDSINWSNLIVWLLLLLEILGNICTAIVCLPSCDVINYEITLCLWSSRFSARPKSRDKNISILRTKRALRWNKKHFSSLLKNFQLPKIVSDLRVSLNSVSHVIWKVIHQQLI